MFLISLANTLLRLASTTAFLCFVVAHLEWPLMNAPCSRGRLAHCRASLPGPGPDLLHEEPVDTALPRDLRMERGRYQRALSDGDDPTRGGAVRHGREHL